MKKKLHKDHIKRPNKDISINLRILGTFFTIKAEIKDERKKNIKSGVYKQDFSDGQSPLIRAIYSNKGIKSSPSIYVKKRVIKRTNEHTNMKYLHGSVIFFGIFTILI